METLEQRKRRLFGKQYLNDYLSVLNKLSLIKIENKDLLSIVETDKIIDKASSLLLSNSLKIEFSNKDELKKEILNIFNYQDRVYLFTSLSKDCGTVDINLLNEFNFNFNYNDDISGIIILISTLRKKKILLDFYEEDEKKYIEIEFYSIQNGME
jgi:hypothetical protein